jgi:hypothetical protein
MKTGAPSINLSKFAENYYIPNLSLEKQKHIVAYCDDIEETIKSMEKRIKNNGDLMKITIETYLKNNDEDSLSDSSSSESESEEETKKKVVKKPVKKTTSKKKVETSSESDSESEESEKEQPKKKVAKTPTNKLSFKK